MIKEITTLYGDLLHIEDDSPRATIRLLEGTTVICPVSSLSLVRQLAQRLNERIGVRGIAQWDIRDMPLQEFCIEELLPYRATSVRDAFNNLRQLVGKYYMESYID